MANKKEIQAEAETRQSKVAPLPLLAPRELMEICYNQAVPQGWIKVNDHWDPTRCGNPTYITYNVWTIERYDNKPVGSLMNVCAKATTPTGWKTIRSYWDPTRCGYPTAIVNNMKQIKRVS